MTMAGWGAARIHVAVGVSASVDLSVTSDMMAAWTNEEIRVQKDMANKPQLTKKKRQRNNYGPTF